MEMTNAAVQGSPTINHIANSLEQRIRQGSYEVGQRLPTERSLAEEFKVSRITIRSAVKEIERRDLVTCSAGCRPVVRGGSSETVRPFRGTSRRSLALWVWPNPSWHGSIMIVNGVRQTLNHDDFRLVLESPGGHTLEAQLRSEDQFLRRISTEHDIEGVILWYLGAAINRPALEALRAADVPMVFLDRLPPIGFEGDYVGVDNARAAGHAVKHLIGLGHRSIAHVTNLDTASTVEERCTGYCQALEWADLPVRPELIVRDSMVGDRAESTIAVMERLLSVHNPPTAVFAVNDQVAFRVLAAVRELGLKVPEDVAVAGFDGLESLQPEPSFLTTVRQPFDQIGARAVELLLDRMATGSTGSYKHVYLDAPLQIGGSTQGKEKTLESRAVRY